jgi:hypothetical protein
MMLAIPAPSIGAGILLVTVKATPAKKTTAKVTAKK